MSGLKEKATARNVSSIRQEASAISGAWEEARLVYPLYFYLTANFHLEIPPAPDPNLPAACPASDVFACVTAWLDLMDGKIRPNQLRQLVHSLNDVKPEALRALILRFLRRKEKTATDRDNIDLLLATYFALCAPEDLYSCEITLHDVAMVLKDVIPDADATELEWCAPLGLVLAALKQCESLRHVFGARLLEKGRELKDAAGFMFYDPAALIAFTRFNFLMRRSFFRLLHADLRAIREGLSELERRGITTVNCVAAGLSGGEPLAHLREIALSWRQPLPKDYAEESANRTFEQLLAIRAAIERALGITPAPLKMPEVVAAGDKQEPKAGSQKGSEKQVFETIERPREVEQGSRTRQTGPRQVTQPLSPVLAALNPNKTQNPEPTQKIGGPEKISLEERTAASKLPADAARTAGPRLEQSTQTRAEAAPASAKIASNDSATAASELDGCLERLWEQLIDAPPARGRSMATVSLDGVRILLSAWEVTAFVSDGGQQAEDLRRAVAARAFVMLTRENVKKTGDGAKLAAAISAGRKEVSYLQSRVDQAQTAKNTEAAVNLGISARRLLSAIEEAQS